MISAGRIPEDARRGVFHTTSLVQNNGGRIGSASTESFKQRQATNASRTIVNSYKHAKIHHTGSVLKAGLRSALSYTRPVQPGRSDASSAAASSNMPTNQARNNKGAVKPVARFSNPTRQRFNPYQ